MDPNQTTRRVMMSCRKPLRHRNQRSKNWLHPANVTRFYEMNCNFHFVFLPNSSSCSCHVLYFEFFFFFWVFFFSTTLSNISYEFTIKYWKLRLKYVFCSWMQLAWISLNSIRNGTSFATGFVVLLFSMLKFKWKKKREMNFVCPFWAGRIFWPQTFYLQRNKISKLKKISFSLSIF